jgi:hypothetical protein
MTSPDLAFRHNLPLYYYVRFQGLPSVCFGDGPDPLLGGVTYSPALRIRNQAISCDLNQGQPVASGRSIDILLDADTLSASGVYQTHFRNPTRITSIDGSLTKSATTVVSTGTGSFDASGSFYWGHEKITYTGKTSANFTGCTRGTGVSSTAINYAMAAPKGVSGIWSLITDVPVLWRGRLVEIWAVAGTPEGFLLGAPFTSSDSSFRIWIGHCDGQPQIVPTGINLRALPAERSIDREYGWGQVWKPHKYKGNFWDRYIYWPSGGTIRLFWVEDASGGGSSAQQSVSVEPLSGKSVDDPERILTVLELWKLAAGLWQANAAVTKCSLQIYPESDSLKMYLVTASAGIYVEEIGVSCEGSAQGKNQAIGALQPSFNYDQALGVIKQPFNHPSPEAIGGFLILNPEEGSDQVYAGKPLDGQQITWKQGDQRRIAGVIRTIDLASQWSDSAYFIVIGSVLYGDPQFDPADVSEIEECLYISGQNSVGSVWNKLLQTSGSAVLASATAGSFGSSDLLPIGWGARIPSDWIDATLSTNNTDQAMAPFIAYDLDAKSLYIDAIAMKVGFVQKFESGVSKINTAPMYAPGEGETLTEISTSKLLAEPINIGQKQKPPNVVVVEFFGSDRKLTVRNRLRIQAEGGVKKETFKVPDHFSGSRLEGLCQEIMNPDQMLSNVYIYEIKLAPEEVWSLNPGDRVKISGTHYAFADFTNGSHRGSSLHGRILGVTRNLDGSGGSIRLAAWGSIIPDYYSPDSNISSVNAGTKTITLPAGRAEWFWQGTTDTVLFYRPGIENTYLEQEVMASSAGNNITFTALPSWLNASTDRITFPVTGSATNRQKMWAHVDDGGSI